jgi:hypothetical protein
VHSAGLGKMCGTSTKALEMHSLAVGERAARESRTILFFLQAFGSSHRLIGAGGALYEVIECYQGATAIIQAP